MLKQAHDNSRDYLIEALQVYDQQHSVDGPSRSLNQWQQLAGRLHDAMHRRAAELNSAVNIAEPVEDMEAFWSLASQTDAGTTSLTIGTLSRMVGAFSLNVSWPKNMAPSRAFS
jgi:hypothetical protein